MEWSGRAPAPPASYAGKGRVSNGAPPCPTNQSRPLPRWASILARIRSTSSASIDAARSHTAGDVRWLPVDLADGKSVARLIEGVVSVHGRLDYAFNNGGSGGSLAPVAKMSETTWRKTIDGYLTSVFLCMSAEIREAINEECSSCAINPSPNDSGLIRQIKNTRDRPT
jgi:NAD(P)-dependent dehydrogenase (short-subunit alcohol dehydrogenase family)